MKRIAKFLFNIRQRFLKWIGKRKSNKLLTFWYIYDSNPYTDSSAQLLTILSDRSQLHEFLVRYYCFSSEHYVSWANFRDLNPNDYKTMEDYFKVKDTPIEVYVEKDKATFNNVTSVVRAGNHCVPLGASYESDDEKTLFDLVYKADLDGDPDGWRDVLNSLIKESQELLEELEKEEDKEPQA